MKTAGSAFIQDAFSHVAIRQVFRPKRKLLPRCAGRISTFAAGIFLMNLTQSTMFKDMYGTRRLPRIRSVKLVKIKNNALLYVLYT